MIVEELVIRGGFLSHQDTRLALPAKGVVLVRGGNGHGKSALIESVAWGCYGKTLRDETPYPAGAKGEVFVRLANAAIHRRFSPKGVKLDWNSELAWRVQGPRVENTTSFLTTSKAQEALTARIGAFDVWQRTHVLTAENVGAFTRATDAERKRLLETLLGLERLEAASVVARAQHDVSVKRTLALNVSAEGGDRVVARYAEELNEALSERVQTPETLPDVAELRDALASAESERAQRVRELNSAHDAVTNTRAAISTHAQRIARGEEELRAAKCARCGQEMPEAKVEALRRSVEHERTKLTAAESARLPLEAAVFAALEAEARACRAVEGAQAELSTALATLAAAGVHEKHVARLTMRLAEAEAEQDELHAQVKAARKDEAVANAAVGVLGTYGVRAQLLRGALSGVEEIANATLAQIATPGIALRLGLKEQGRAEVTLALEGMADGRGYKAASSGQKRRVDVALLFALAEVAASASGTARGTLWCDEVFDSLDGAGRAAVAEALDEQAQDRCVVVITHEDDLADAFQNLALQLQVKDGKVEVV